MREGREGVLEIHICLEQRKGGSKIRRYDGVLYIDHGSHRDNGDVLLCLGVRIMWETWNTLALSGLFTLLNSIVLGLANIVFNHTN